METKKEFSSVNAWIEDLHRQLDKECDDAMERDRRTSMKKTHDIFSGGHYGGEQNITCPVCGDDYTHIREVYTLLGSDQHEAGVIPGTEAKARTDERRSGLAIKFRCEAGHDFQLVIQQHKGVNLIEVGVRKSGVTWE